MPIENFHGASNYFVTIAEFPGLFFTEFSGGESNNDTSLQHTGGFGPPQVISGPASTGQITITKPEDQVLDIPLKAWDAAYQLGNQIPLTVTVQPTLPNGIPAGPARTYTECKRVSMTRSQPSKGSSEAATTVLVLQPRAFI